MLLSKKIILLSIGTALFVGCASPQVSERKEKRDKVAQNAKLYCEFVNGEVYPDIDVALNLEMAKKCDSEKSMSLTSYRSPSEATGIVYCCTMKGKDEAKLDALGMPKTEVKKPVSPISPTTPAAKPEAPAEKKQ